MVSSNSSGEASHRYCTCQQSYVLNEVAGSPSSTPAEPKTAGATEHIEQVHTNERVPGHENYYEKNGLRTYGDDADHDHAPKMTFKRMMSLIAMAFCECCHLPNLCERTDSELGSVDRITDSRIPLRWCPTIRLPRHWRSRSLDLVRPRQLAFARCCLSIRWLHFRPDRASLGSTDWSGFYRGRYDHLLNSSHDEHLHRRHGIRRHRCWR